MIEKLEKFLGVLGYTFQYDDYEEILIYHNCMPWKALLCKEDGDFYRVCFYFRTNFGVGERTDIHEIIPTLIAILFRVTSSFSFRFLGQHNEWSGIESELYGMYILPSQPLCEIVRINSEEDIKIFEDYFSGLFIIYQNIHEFINVTNEEEETHTWEGEKFLVWEEKVIEAYSGPRF